MIDSFTPPDPPLTLQSGATVVLYNHKASGESRIRWRDNTLYICNRHCVSYEDGEPDEFASMTTDIEMVPIIVDGNTFVAVKNNSDHDIIANHFHYTTCEIDHDTGDTIDMVEIGTVTNGTDTYNAFKYTRYGHSFYLICDQYVTGVKNGSDVMRNELYENYHWISDLGDYTYSKKTYNYDPFNSGFSEEDVGEGN